MSFSEPTDNIPERRAPELDVVLVSGRKGRGILSISAEWPVGISTGPGCLPRTVRARIPVRHDGEHAYLRTNEDPMVEVTAVDELVGETVPSLLTDSMANSITEQLPDAVRRELDLTIDAHAVGRVLRATNRPAIHAPASKTNLGFAI